MLRRYKIFHIILDSKYDVTLQQCPNRYMTYSYSRGWGCLAPVDVDDIVVDVGYGCQDEEMSHKELHCSRSQGRLRVDTSFVAGRRLWLHLLVSIICNMDSTISSLK